MSSRLLSIVMFKGIVNVCPFTFCGHLFHFYCPRSEEREGYFFTGVCHSVTEQRGGTPNASLDRSHGHRGDDGGQRSTNSLRDRITHLSHPWTTTHPPWTTPPPPIIIHTGTTVNGRAVRILLECILVRTIYTRTLVIIELVFFSELKESNIHT